jgi:hypothetical protein
MTPIEFETIMTPAADQAAQRCHPFVQQTRGLCTMPT